MFAELYDTPDGRFFRIQGQARKNEVRVKVSEGDEGWLEICDILRTIRMEAAGDWQRLLDYTNPVYRVELQMQPL